MNDLQTITTSVLLLVIVGILMSYVQKRRKAREHRARVNESFRLYVQMHGGRE